MFARTAPSEWHLHTNLRSGILPGRKSFAGYFYSDDGNSDLEKLAYGNNDVVEYTRDDQGRVIETAYGKEGETARDTVTYQYDTSGSLATVYDSESGITASYAYDLSDRLHKYLETGSGHSVMLRYNYDEENRLSTVRESINGWSRLSRYTYDKDNRLTEFQKAYGFRNYTYDDFNRVTQTTTKDHDTQVLKTEYSFNDTATTVSGQVTEVAHTYASHAKADLTYSYTYDDKGNILTVTDDAGTTSYVYDGGTLLRMKKGSEHMMFAHSPDGVPLSIVYDDLLYYYVTNVQGDVVAILDASGDPMVTYTYDAWGNPLTTGGSMATTLGRTNPLRYRGYVYDQETGLYYVSSRYYDPEIGRWINGDGLVDNRGLNTQNTFQYCGNNPVMYADPSGQLFGLIALGVLGVGLIIGLSGCSTTPAPAPSTSASAPAPSKPAPIPSQPAQKPLTTDQKVLIATIAAEATVTAQGKPVSSAGRQAMANVAINRVGSREWSKYTTVAEICQFTGFDGYGDKNYQACMTYLNSRDGSNATYEAIIWDVMAAYDNDITGGAQLYYTPAAMKPAGSSPNWNFSVLTEVTIPGVDPYYEGRFYKYK